jgi:hypothetical protein
MISPALSKARASLKALRAEQQALITSAASVGDMPPDRVIARVSLLESQIFGLEQLLLAKELNS